MRRPRLLFLLAALGTGLGAVATPAPAAADPAQPTNFRSTIVSVEPALPPGVRLSVVGGDAFLELRVPRGHTALVPDYEQGRGQRTRPYLRFRSDGVVERNDASLAALVNDGRFGANAGLVADPGEEPRWRVVARNGRYAWHDHRIHWMLRQPPSAVDERGRVDLGSEDGTWGVPLVVDGRPVTVRGELYLLATPSPMPWFALAGAIAFGLIGIAVAAHRRRRPVPHVVLSALLAGFALAATVVAVAAWRARPPGTGPGPTGALVAATGAALAGATVLALRLQRHRVARATLACSVAALGGWAVLRAEVWSHAWLPTVLPFAVDRAVTAMVLGAAAGQAAVLVWRPPTPRAVHATP